MKKIYCNEINIKFINKDLLVYGWVKNKKEFKKIIFIDLRDNTGIIQIIFLKNVNDKLFNEIKKVTIESCIKVIINVKKKNDCFELIAKNLFLIGISDKLPINLEDNNISENIKLKYRYLYLRKPKFFEILKTRSDIMWNINNFMYNKKFIYIETPILSKPMIEGAKNYLIKSRIYIDKFYSLSQSPQIFKQILMISGYDKYYQFAKCFRDEDLRKNRQPEFTQLDIEASFVNEDYIIKISECLIKFLFKKIKKICINNIPKITYSESILNFGSDKPDLRNPLRIINLIDIMIKNNIIIDKYYYIYFIFIPKPLNNILINKYKYKYFDNNINIYSSELYNIKSILHNLNKIFSDNIIDNVINILLLNNSNKYNNFILIYSKKDYLELIGKFITNISNDLNLINNNDISIIWVKDFPMFKKNNGILESMHHPFTSPKYFSNISDMIKKPESILSNSYDLIINGNEIASGSVRINNELLQKSIFDILNISKYEQEKYFGFFLNALKFGTPNHAGIAFGLDRLVMLMTNSENIKDVIAFPKSTSSYDFMTNSPINI